jgi:AraC-like DNA-binding protein
MLNSESSKPRGRELYEAACVETDREKLTDLINRVEEALTERGQELGHSPDHADELNAMAQASGKAELAADKNEVGTRSDFGTNSYALGEFARAPHIRSVLEVTKEAGLSRRRFAQLFREQVGLTPKLFCRLHRFRGVLRQIALGAPVDWADIALAGGYCDQSHLVHEFRDFSGTSPSAYLASERTLANRLPAD